MTASLALALLLLLAPAALAAQAAEASLGVIPRPRALMTRPGAFTLGPRTVVWTDAASAAKGRQLARALEPATGYALAVRTGGAPPATDVIELRRDPALAASLGPEGYRLSVRPGRVVARAAGEAGLFYAAQTMRQLLPPAVFRDAPVPGVAWTMPAVEIEDAPRFAWRGAHLDVARHFMPKAFVKRYIDLLALHKLNVFHWHLTDDQGWRLAIRKYPRLTEVGAWRAATLVGKPHTDTTNNTYDGTRHGGFYTQDDAREIVAYAAARHVAVVPEIEMPGHARAAIAAYPELGVTGEAIPVWTNWGVTPHILNADERTVAFMQDVLTEVLAIFPSRFVHVGGDEAAKDLWKTSPRVQARIRELGLKDEHELQSWFIRRMDAFLTQRGRRLVGWDEILEGGLAPGATVMSWRGTQGGIAAARAGHDVVMAPGRWTYFDQYQSTDQTREPPAFGGFLPVDTVYAFEPVPRELDAAQARRVLGAQWQLWTEYVPTTRHAEYMVFPRAAALAEVVWTPAARKDLAGFRARLARHLARLDALDVGYRRDTMP
ncbi:beta-N-acetylhexosaminidase [Roseisolibacter sp. H3M3-2]|uniref:beta-N-acetylhexosaminidase n=1 Tax=Roseisolibacter sp. H3M3-2 TaxID=3031323 RepID=UPI0023DB518B|nr:beta-N-acetylhexosaminidase [Roseisolibacter sp. H3M3-2]MDF1504220.1 beta-N-acetylhexosaminidase [Roseisolibacter sp. H3M3-2]